MSVLKPASIQGESGLKKGKDNTSSRRKNPLYVQVIKTLIKRWLNVNSTSKKTPTFKSSWKKVVSLLIFEKSCFVCFFSLLSLRGLTAPQLRRRVSRFPGNDDVF